MLNAVAFSNDSDTGLSQEDLRTATALIHCWYRGHFSGITHKRSTDGDVALVVWGTGPTDEPMLTINRSNDRFVLTDETTGQVYVADAIEAVLEGARDRFPHITAL